MVKLFVGNLADSVDSNQLRSLFLQYVHVQECDVLKNYAFVHVATDEDAETAITKLQKHVLEGREIHIERSTSRLRKEPGMGDKCFTCGATDHKTPQCPLEGSTSTTAKKSLKREEPGDDGSVNTGSKKARLLSSYPQSYPTSKTRITPQKISTTILGGGGAQPSSQLPPQQQQSQPQCWGYKVGGGSDTDPELPCPQNPELRTLYEQYLESRTRYFFYRERLTKELRSQPCGGAAAPVVGQVQPSQPQQPIHLGRVDLTKIVGSQPPHQQTAASVASVMSNVVSAVQQSQGFAGSGQPQSVNVAPSGYSPYGTQPQGSLPPATVSTTYAIPSQQNYNAQQQLYSAPATVGYNNNSNNGAIPQQPQQIRHQPQPQSLLGGGSGMIQQQPALKPLIGGSSSMNGSSQQPPSLLNPSPHGGIPQSSSFAGSAGLPSLLNINAQQPPLAYGGSSQPPQSLFRR